MNDFENGGEKKYEPIPYDWQAFPLSDPSEFDSEVERTLSDFSMPVEAEISSYKDIIPDFQTRLEAMGVENPSNLNRRRIRRHKDLFLHPLSLEDVHYVAYADKRRQESNMRYISVTVADILKFMPESMHEISGLQSDQTSGAHAFLAEFGITGQELGEMHDNGDRDSRFAMRSLHRLLMERRLDPFLKRLKPQPGETVPFQTVALAAVNKLEILHKKHLATRPKSRDSSMQYALDERDFRRSLSFSRPLKGELPE